MIADGKGGSAMMTTPEQAKTIMSKGKHELVPQLRFAPGFHFLPTDFELLDVYLRGKIEGREPQLDIFKEVDFLKRRPEEIIAERKAYGEDTYFFFTQRKKCMSNKDGQPRRKLHGEMRASWKATGSVLKILHPGTGELVGTRRMLTYSCERRNDEKYSMYEYVLADRPQLDQWVLCTVKEKQNWNANVDEDDNASGSGKEKKASGGKDKKRNRGTETLVKPKTTTRKKTATSQPQEETQQQEKQQEITPDISSDQPPLLGHAQVDHHQAFEETGPMTQAVEYLDGDQPYYHDASTQEEMTTWDGPDKHPLMTHQQQGYQASMEEQFNILGAPYMLKHQFSPIAQFHPQYLMIQYHEEEQQALPPHCTYGYELLQHQTQHWLGTQGVHGGITGPLQDVPKFLQESGKPHQTSPDSVLGGPDPEPPSGDAYPYPYSHSDAGMMDGIASTVNTQAASYGSAPDRQFNPVDFVGHSFDDDLAGNGGGSHVAMGLVDHRSNQALYPCQHGVQRRCRGQQGVDMENCFLCITSCAKCHSI